ncbi:hypothetical protein [Reyranella soli]|uniref:Uncharacterized protein n=1 Tax=Reyranella soli TaxID=1230389 RepID=A0A512NNC1_9HYPH|nr:hypothetical protein [Reyranella soli]GEP60445.1 hypothetical protein RSO01_76110 [Reyranella soli]
MSPAVQERLATILANQAEMADNLRCVGLILEHLADDRDIDSTEGSKAWLGVGYIARQIERMYVGAIETLEDMERLEKDLPKGAAQ